MQPLFENKYTVSKQQLKEFYRYFFFKQPILIIINLFFAIAAVIGLIQLIYPTLLYLFDYSEIIILIPVLLFSITIFRYKRAVKIGYARMLELNQGKETECLVNVTADEIVLHNVSNGAVSHISFFQVVKIIETKNLYMLMLKSKIIISFKKDSFTIGTLDGLKSFINAHCLPHKRVY